MSDDKIRTKERFSLEKNIAKINKIISKYRAYTLRKNVKTLIEKNKNSYSIISTLTEKNLKLIVYFPTQIKEYEFEVIYEKIFHQNIVYIPKDDCQKIFLLKFHFINEKNESIIDPKYNNDFSDHMFLNVINLKKLIEKEEERKEDFQSFLESYSTSDEISEDAFKYFFRTPNVRKKNKKRTLTVKHSALKLKKIEHKIKSENNLLSILKTRKKKRVPSGKRISFGTVTKLEYYTVDM